MLVSANSQQGLAQNPSVTLDLSSAFNAKAASIGLNDTFANFDGSGRAYPVEFLPTTSTLQYLGIEFALPPFHSPDKYDTVQSNSQTITVSANNTTNGTRFQSLHALATSVWPASGSGRARTGTLTFVFGDGTSQDEEILVGPWWETNPFDGPIHTPWHYANATLDYGMTISHNVTSISYVTTRIANDKALHAIKLPASGSYINFFAISLLSSDAESASSQGATGNDTAALLSVQAVRSTTKWLDSNSTTAEDRIQQIEVTLNNLSPLSGPQSQWITAPHTVSLVSDSNSLETVVPGRIVRLRSNDQIVVSVGIRSAQLKAGTKVAVKVVFAPDDKGGQPHGGEVQLMNGDEEFEIVAGIPEWESTDESLGTHEPPEWYQDAKFGIFVHWGVYSVPAWAPTGKQYAEWYNWDLHNPPDAGNPTWTRHLQVYGADVVYDNFIANFTASAWNPDDWTDLFADAGAKYFVLVTKHHDGFALFDTGNSSHRNSLLLGPKRDLLKDLFASAKTRHPELRRGTYFSLPEWFNPDYAPYGRTSFPGHPALNAFNGSCCDPYTGHVPVNNFLEDVQRPQMEKLWYDYDTEILWCDIGGYSAFPAIGAAWYNYAASQGRQVVMNNRCGANQSDFVTPEYATFPAPLSQKWESSAGMDPYSYGYNSDTPPNAYQNASSIITELIDIVSKGGNFLLECGPKADGTIIPAMTGPLRQVGQWLKVAGDSIYGTRPWWIQPADTTAGLTNVRFTTTTDAFYIIAVSRPTGGHLQTAAPVPIMKGDQVTLLGGSGQALEWNVDGNGVLTVNVDDGELDKLGLPAWAFKVSFNVGKN